MIELNFKQKKFLTCYLHEYSCIFANPWVSKLIISILPFSLPKSLSAIDQSLCNQSILQHWSHEVHMYLLRFQFEIPPLRQQYTLLVQLFPTAFVGGSQAVAEHFDCYVQGYQMLIEEERVGFATIEESWVRMNQVVLFTQAHHESGFSTTQQQNWSMSCRCWKSCSSRVSLHCYKRQEGTGLEIHKWDGDTAIPV